MDKVRERNMSNNEMQKITEVVTQMAEAVSPHMKNGVVAKVAKAITKEINNLETIIKDFEKTGTSKELPVPNEYVDYQIESIDLAKFNLQKSLIELNKLLK